jgi:hypothetical protein
MASEMADNNMSHPTSNSIYESVAPTAYHMSAFEMAGNAAEDNLPNEVTDTTPDSTVPHLT